MVLPTKEIFTLTDFKTLISCYSQDNVWAFPGGPGVKTPCFHCKAHGLNPWLGKIKAKVAQSCPTFCIPMDYTIHGILQARILDSLSLLQGIFPTQGSNPDLPHCSQILYQLSHKGSTVEGVINHFRLYCMVDIANIGILKLCKIHTDLIFLIKYGQL